MFEKYGKLRSVGFDKRRNDGPELNSKMHPLQIS